MWIPDREGRRLPQRGRFIDLIDRGRYPVQKVVTARIAMADVVEKDFETLLSPQGDQVKVLVRATEGES